MLAVSAATAQPLQRADMEKLRDPASRDAEVSRLARCGKDKRTLAGYHLLTANQKDARPPLHVLCANSDYHFESAVDIHGNYKIEKPEELFGKIASPVTSQLEPSLDPVRKSLILVLDSGGKEIRPFAGNNYIDEGYCFDFDQDGVLDRADSTNHALDEAPDTSVQVFKLQTIEPIPRVLLEVIFNWHPESAADSNEWTFTCFDEEKDGIVEIAFGPGSAVELLKQRQIVFRMDPVTRCYSGGDIPVRSHVRIVAPGETLASVAKSGGLGYPLSSEPTGSRDDKPAPPSPQAPYVFRSLKDRPASELAAFFTGKDRPDLSAGSEDSFPNKVPEGFWSLDPKQAAIALAEANRTPTHREGWKLALDDRGGIVPPKSGWLLHNWGSSSCCSFSSHLFALRFGVQEPSLIVFEYNSIGVVGRNPWADQPAHSVRVIRLSDQEASFLADTVFWLDRIRTFPLRKADGFGGMSSSTGDGSATVSLFPDGGPPRKLASETVWDTSTISGKWDSDYTRTTFVNLAELLIGDSFPPRLGERWNVAPEIGHHSLGTPTADRLTPRVDDDARQKLSDSFAAILLQHAKDPVPAHALEKLASAAGDEALTGVLPGLRQLFAGFPALTDEDREFATLEKRFERDHFGNPQADEPAEHKQAHERFIELRDKREFLPSAILRDPLADSIERLRIAGSAEELEKTVKGNGPSSPWALSQLRRLDPDAWSDILTGQFETAEMESRRTIFQTLAAGHPSAARALVTAINPADYSELIIEIAGYHQKHDVDSVTKDIPVLMELVRDKGQNYIRRGQAVALLAEVTLDPGMLQEFTTLLVAEIKHPQQGEYGMDTLDPAIRALTRLPDAGNHLELITTVPGIADRAYDAGVEAIVRLAPDSSDRENLLAGFIRPLFQKSKGMMNDIFLDALAHDLRGLAPDLAAFASEGPAMNDGDGANYSGGAFKTPVGQRYHMAREITALWSEKDPATLGRMWIYFAAAHPYQFNPLGKDQTLAGLAAEKIRYLPKEQLREEIDTALTLIPIPKYSFSSEAWLRSLGQK